MAKVYKGLQIRDNGNYLRPGKGEGRRSPAWMPPGIMGAKGTPRKPFEIRVSTTKWPSDPPYRVCFLTPSSFKSESIHEIRITSISLPI